MAEKIQFVGPIIRAALAALKADLPTQIAIFNAEAENGVDLVVPVVYAFGADDPLGVSGFPVVEVAAAQGRTGNFAVERTEFDHDPAITICVWHEGDRGEFSTTYEMSLGLARCVIETLLADDAFGPDAEIPDRADGGGIYWRSDALPADPTDDGREFRKWRVPVLIQFDLQAVERFVTA